MDVPHKWFNSARIYQGMLCNACFYFFFINQRYIILFSLRILTGQYFCFLVGFVLLLYLSNSIKWINSNVTKIKIPSWKLQHSFLKKIRIMLHHELFHSNCAVAQSKLSNLVLHKRVWNMHKMDHMAAVDMTTK